MSAHYSLMCVKCDVVSYRAEIGEEAEWRGAVDPERQEVLQLGMSLRLEGSTRQRQGAQEWVDLALGEGTYSREEKHITVLLLHPVKILHLKDTFSFKLHILQHSQG